MHRKTKKEKIFDTSIKVITLAISLWALLIAYQAKNSVDWLEKVQDNIIENVLFKNK